MWALWRPHYWPTGARGAADIAKTHNEGSGAEQYEAAVGTDHCLVKVHPIAASSVAWDVLHDEGEQQRDAGLWPQREPEQPMHADGARPEQR